MQKFLGKLENIFLKMIAVWGIVFLVGMVVSVTGFFIWGAVVMFQTHPFISFLAYLYFAGFGVIVVFFCLVTTLKDVTDKDDDCYYGGI